MAEKKSVNNGIATLRIRRVANGLEIFIQSEVLERLFSSLPDSRVREVGFGPLEGLKAYYFAEEVAPRLVDEEGSRIAYIWRINDNLFVNGRANLSFFRLVGVSSGLSVVFPGVYSIRQVEDLVSAVKEALKILVNNCIKIKKEG
jgi:hypothetical protein